MFPSEEHGVAEVLQRFDPLGGLARADHRLHPRRFRDRVLEVAERGQALGVGDRAVGAHRDHLEGGVPAGADRLVDQFGVLAGGGLLGQLLWARRAGLEPDRRHRQNQQDGGDQRRHRRRPLQCRADQGHQARAPTRRPERIAEASPEEARRLCRGAIVGSGRIEALISLAARPVAANSPLTIFNGPRSGGDPTVVLHAQTTTPGTQTFAIVVPIERRRGQFRYRATLDLPPIAAGLGAITHVDVKIGRRFSAGGQRHSYVSARCSNGILQTHGRFTFADGTIIDGSVEKFCRAR
jgi:hypothetical protein